MKNNQSRILQKLSSYFLTVDGSRVACKKMFQNSLDISEHTERTTIVKVSRRVLLAGKRELGRQSKDAEICESISMYISRFPKVLSHYCSARSIKQYFHSDLSLPQMYAMYVREFSEGGKLDSQSTKEYFMNKTLHFINKLKNVCSSCIKFREGND